jgi:hypothetical protein
MYMYILGMTVYRQCMYMETDDRRDAALQERSLGELRLAGVARLIMTLIGPDGK